MVFAIFFPVEYRENHFWIQWFIYSREFLYFFLNFFHFIIIYSASLCSLLHVINYGTVIFLSVICISHLCMGACVLSHFSHVRLCETLWTVARQAPLSMGFSRQKYWSGLPCPPPGNLCDPGHWTLVSYVSCIGRQVLYRWSHLGSAFI